jgi:hypothetical protein
MSTMDAIARALQQAKTFASLLIRRGELSTSPQSFFCQLAGFADESLDDVELWAHFGIASRPPSGTQALTVHLNGLSEEAICVASESQADRPTDLDEGEAVLYGLKSAAGQAQARAKPDGTLALSAAFPTKFVEVGGNSDALIKGNTFNTSHATMLGLVSAYVALIGAAFQALGADVGFAAIAAPATVAAINAANAAAAALATVGITAFTGTAAPAALSLKAKVG